MSDWRRMHPASIATGLTSDVRQAITALLPAAVSIGSSGFSGWLLRLPFLGVLVAPVIRYLTLRYETTSDSLVVQGGLIRRYRNVLPLERIHAVDTVAGLLHRVFGVVEVRVEVAGGGKTEARLYAVTKAEAARVVLALRRTGQQGVIAAEETGQVVAKCTPKELVISAITGGRSALFAILIANIFQQFGESIVGRFRTTTAAVGILVLLLVGSIVVSIVLYVLRSWGWTLSLHETNLVITRGLTSLRKTTVPLHRLQAIQIKQSLIHRVLGVARMKMVVAGYETAEGAGADDTSQLLPLSKKGQAMAIAERLLGQGSIDVPISSAPARSFVSKLAPLPLLVGIAWPALVLTREVPEFFSLIIILLATPLIFLHWRNRKFGADGRFAISQSGTLGTELSILPLSNIAHVSLIKGPRQRLMKLSAVKLSAPKISLRLGETDDALADGYFRFVAGALLT